MSRPEDHFLRAADIAAGQRHLSELTGLSRIAIETHVLDPGETLVLAAAGERFVYVLHGSGTVTSAGESQTIEAGDFLALEAGETAAVQAGDSLTLFSGQLSSQ